MEAVAGVEGDFLARQAERQRLSVHRQTLIQGLETQWAGQVVGQVELCAALAGAEVKSFATYKQLALVELSGQPLALVEEQAVLSHVSKFTF